MDAMTRRGMIGGTLATGALMGLEGTAKAVAGGPWSQGVWLNRPAQTSITGDALAIVTDKGTDFWRETHYGFTRDSGHFLGFETGEGEVHDLLLQFVLVVVDPFFKVVHRSVDRVDDGLRV